MSPSAALIVATQPEDGRARSKTHAASCDSGEPVSGGVVSAGDGVQELPSLVHDVCRSRNGHGLCVDEFGVEAPLMLANCVCMQVPEPSSGCVLSAVSSTLWNGFESPVALSFAVWFMVSWFPVPPSWLAKPQQRIGSYCVCDAPAGAIRNSFFVWFARFVDFPAAPVSWWTLPSRPPSTVPWVCTAPDALVRAPLLFNWVRTLLLLPESECWKRLAQLFGLSGACVGAQSGKPTFAFCDCVTPPISRWRCACTMFELF